MYVVLDISGKCLMAQFVCAKSVIREEWGSVPEQVKIVNEVGGKGTAEGSKPGV